MVEYRCIENYPNYMISNKGNVMNINTKKILKGKIGSSGFLNVNLWNDNKFKSVTIHSLVGKAFVENPLNYHFLIHIDNDKLNNNYDNLFYYKTSCELVFRKRRNKKYEKFILNNNTIYFN